jgi:hypothetical protein
MTRDMWVAFFIFTAAVVALAVLIVGWCVAVTG